MDCFKVFVDFDCGGFVDFDCFRVSVALFQLFWKIGDIVPIVLGFVWILNGNDMMLKIRGMNC